MWFLVLKDKKGRWELTPKCLLSDGSFAQATSGLSQTVWWWSKILLSVTCRARTFLHIGKVLIQCAHRRTHYKGVFTLNLWMYKGSWRPPEKVGYNYSKLKGFHIIMSHISSGNHSSTPAADLHKILHPTLKGEPQAGSNLILPSPWNKVLET